MVDTDRTSKAKTPKLTDAERHRRFLDMAQKVEASDRPEDFDAVLERLARYKPKKRQNEEK
jgi:hypothetical protein